MSGKVQKSVFGKRWTKQATAGNGLPAKYQMGMGNSGSTGNTGEPIALAGYYITAKSQKGCASAILAIIPDA